MLTGRLILKKNGNLVVPSRSQSLFIPRRGFGSLSRKEMYLNLAGIIAGFWHIACIDKTYIAIPTLIRLPFDSLAPCSSDEHEVTPPSHGQRWIRRGSGLESVDERSADSQRKWEW
jgi:hypothetical protein